VSEPGKGRKLNCSIAQLMAVPLGAFRGAMIVSVMGLQYWTGQFCERLERATCCGFMLRAVERWERVGSVNRETEEEGKNAERIRGSWR